jgi:hypothetical protein
MNSKKITKGQLLVLLHTRYGSMSVRRKEAAEILGYSTSTLDRRRANGEGPIYRKDIRSANGEVTYLLTDLIDYLYDHDMQITISQSTRGLN